MIRYSLDDFRTWLLSQGDVGRQIMCQHPLHELHTICLNFTEEYENEAIREEIAFEKRRKEQLDTERAAAHAARESAARKCAADAVRAEVDYDAEMTLPEGKTCADCIHVDRCVDVLGCTNPESTRCNFYPNRFSHSYQED